MMLDILRADLQNGVGEDTLILVKLFLSSLVTGYEWPRGQCYQRTMSLIYCKHYNQTYNDDLLYCLGQQELRQPAQTKYLTWIARLRVFGVITTGLFPGLDMA